MSSAEVDAAFAEAAIAIDKMQASLALFKHPFTISWALWAAWIAWSYNVGVAYPGREVRLGRG